MAASPPQPHVSGVLHLPGHARVNHTLILVVPLDGQQLPEEDRTVRLTVNDGGFTPEVAAFQVPSRLEIRNEDKQEHDIYCPRGPTVFDMGVMVKGHGPKSVVVTEPGRLDVYCSRFVEVRSTLVALESGMGTVVSPQGAFTLPALEAGRWRLTTWQRDPSWSTVSRIVTFPYKGVIDLTVTE